MKTKPINKPLEFGGKSLEELYKEIQEIYFSNNYPWIIGYSGGKDSTATLQLVWEALEKVPRIKLNKPIYVLSSDTLVEIPKVVNYVDKSLELINKSAKEKGMPIYAVKVTPEISDTFWVNLIGRGYPAPTNEFRWCTDRLKIDPTNKFVVETASKYGEVIVVLGVRKTESINREKTINEHKIENFRLSRHTTLPGAFVYTPIEDWTVDEVWDYLIRFKSPWGGNNRELFEMYKQANAGECPVIIELKEGSESQSCGNSRFGCWVCTVVKNEKSLSALIESGESWLKPLQEFRELLVETQDPEKKHIYRDYKRRDGNIYFLRHREKEGVKELGRGPYKFKYRKHFLEKLLLAEKRIQEKTGYDISLISQDELIEIQRIWKLEEGDWENSVYQIYEKVYGKSLSVPKEDIGIFSAEDRTLIEEIAKEEDIDPKLVIKLLNTYQYNRNLSRKSSLLKKLEKVLNEEWRTEEEILNEVNK
ncbi:DNA phosphorothioation system sulfurtransferase DndC [Persephonella atlantica]|uniref:DNA phosphorothioation system sulfurtransferase DndC n=1 Tax=Persephonella atlantica TaxID=2699429 RepID=A0ABS1GJM1_9AQUI|nr:DNA phosphorothioation system sulfurtransferase DndC [Persephonella atlantica]MBK3333122.1 DNA phosphorothioation system sulfurtransferase DndC [Persephonella atlantica]